VYQAKPSRRERNAGLDGLPEKRRSTDYGAMKTRACNVCESRSNRNGRWPNCDHDDWRWDEQNEDGHKGGNATNHHPTVKPVALMRHLVRLVTPPGGTVLDPFAGSGTTLVAAVLEGMNAIGCEMTDEYLPIIRGRVAWAEEQARAAAEAKRTLSSRRSCEATTCTHARACGGGVDRDVLRARSWRRARAAGRTD
jgi:hypothetical protein